MTLTLNDRDYLFDSLLDSVDSQIVARGGWRVRAVGEARRLEIARGWWRTMERTGDYERAKATAQRCCSVLVWLAVGQLIVSILRLIWEATHDKGAA